MLFNATLLQYLAGDAEHKEQNIKRILTIKIDIYRCDTSIGTNVREHKHAQSDADFLIKMSIAYKETYETDFWFKTSITITVISVKTSSVC